MKSRIAIVSDSLPPAGNSGIGTSHANLMAALIGAGFECHGFTFQDDRTPPSGEISRFGFPRPLQPFLNRVIQIAIRILRKTKALSNDRGLISESSVSIVGAIAGLFLIPRIKKFKPDYIVVPDKGAVGAFWPKSLKERTIFISHSNPLRFVGNPLIGDRSLADARLAVRIEQKALNGCLAAVCPSTYMRGAFVNTYRFTENIFTLPNAIDFDLVESTQASDYFSKSGLSKGDPVVYIPAASNHNKGRQFNFEIIRRTAKEYGRPIGFYLSGALDSELAKCLEYLPENARVLSPGSKPYSENLSLIKACAICISPTLIESFGMALLEAQALGLPVIAFNAGGNAEIVLNTVTGYCTDMLDLETLITFSVALLNNTELRKQMSDSSKERAQRLFGTEAIGNGFQDILLKIRRYQN